MIENLEEFKDKKTFPSHEYFMALALNEAKKAYARREVPVGAIVVDAENRIVSKAYNQREALMLSTAHAEHIAIEDACRALKSWRLSNCRLYVTLEPCHMCIGAIVLSRLDTVIYATTDPKGGAIESVDKVLTCKSLNHIPKLVSGILKNEASELLKSFFHMLRKK
jgi:tRNA(adenine34) deaminase